MAWINWRKWAFDQLHPDRIWLLVIQSDNPHDPGVDGTQVTHFALETDEVKARGIARRAQQRGDLIFFGKFILSEEYEIKANGRTYKVNDQLRQGMKNTHVRQAARAGELR